MDYGEPHHHLAFLQRVPAMIARTGLERSGVQLRGVRRAAAGLGAGGAADCAAGGDERASDRQRGVDRRVRLSRAQPELLAFLDDTAKEPNDTCAGCVRVARITSWEGDSDQNVLWAKGKHANSTVRSALTICFLLALPCRAAAFSYPCSLRKLDQWPFVYCAVPAVPCRGRRTLCSLF